jgi:hypothetical protein
VRSRREPQKCRPFDSRFSKVLKMGLQIPDLRRFLSFARQGRHWVESRHSAPDFCASQLTVPPLSAPRCEDPDCYNTRRGSTNRASAVTRSRCHVVCVIAPLAVQNEVLRAAGSRVVGHVGGASNDNSRNFAARRSIADDRAALTGFNIEDAVAEGVIAGNNPSSGNPGTPASRHGIVLDDPISRYPWCGAWTGDLNAQSLDDGSVSGTQVYSVADPI